MSTSPPTAPARSEWPSSMLLFDLGRSHCVSANNRQSTVGFHTREMFNDTPRNISILAKPPKSARQSGLAPLRISLPQRIFACFFCCFKLVTDTATIICNFFLRLTYFCFQKHDGGTTKSSILGVLTFEALANPWKGFCTVDRICIWLRAECFSVPLYEIANKIAPSVH